MMRNLENYLNCLSSSQKFCLFFWKLSALLCIVVETFDHLIQFILVVLRKTMRALRLHQQGLFVRRKKHCRDREAGDREAGEEELV